MLLSGFISMLSFATFHITSSLPVVQRALSHKQHSEGLSGPD